MLGLRKQSLQMQSPYKTFNFVVQRHQLQRSPHEPLIPCLPPTAMPAGAGAPMPPAFTSPSLGVAVNPCPPKPLNHEIFCAPPPAPPHRRQEGPLQHRRGSQQQLKKGQSSGCLRGSWDGFTNAGPLLPLPRVTPSGPPLLPTPRGPPIAAAPIHQLDHGGLLTGYWGSARPATGSGTHTGVSCIPGSPVALGGPPVKPSLRPHMQHDGGRIPVQAMLLQQRDLVERQLHDHLQQRLFLQGVHSAAAPENTGSPNPDHLPRATRASKSPRKSLGCSQQRRQKQRQQPLHSQNARNQTTVDQRNDLFTEALPLSNEAALQKLLGMVTSLLMSRSACKELQQQQQP
ncbi:hypothetical protein EBH_0038330 [Eimeria brunetti]|uniref:Uncharacterized protein n=1 Tax=Eimeria brunetti TaxID=51314 RepID=U6LV91_9EIME|nr:hypothetical protein EBH_0038330 [Eimeria brunetti]